MIEAEGLTKKFGGVTAVQGLTLNVEKGEVFGFLGPNGAGKTTTVRMLCCLISKTSGEATIGGLRIGRSEDQLKIRQMVGVLPENVGLYEDLTAYRNLDFYGQLYRCTKQQIRERAERLLRMLGLWERRDDLVGTFSKGMKQKVAIARSLIHDPPVLFLHGGGQTRHAWGATAQLVADRGWRTVALDLRASWREERWDTGTS